MTFRSLLTQKNLSADKLSAKIKKDIKKYDTIESLMEQRKQELLQEKNQRKKKSIEKEIAEAEDALKEMDAALNVAIERYDKYKDTYAASASRLNAGRKKNLNSTGGNAPASQDPPTPPPANPDPVNEPPAPESQSQPEKKSSGIGWLVGGLLVAGLAAIGINYYNNK